MIVSWTWLSQYVALEMDRAELEHRFSMTGLNHEGTEEVGQDFAIDLEVTSNRPDCLGHIGVAREVSVLWDTTLKVPDPQPTAEGPAVDTVTKVRIDCPDLCQRYTARVIQGVKVGPSPQWLVERLQTLGIPAINNIVDITNFVMMECGQPLHAFDFAKLDGPEIIVRASAKGEVFAAINHNEYKLATNMCVIADASKAVALGGVMGGVDSEISAASTDVLIEAADFAPLSIRSTSRSLILPSDSSFRFERGVDPEAVDWASRRCCQLILELAGGTLAKGVLDVGPDAPVRQPITLRYAQVERVLGIDTGAATTRKILTDLGCLENGSDDETVTVVPPTWRRDLTREIDLIEEVARIYGYDKIPEDVGVPMAASQRHDWERVLSSVRQVLTSVGFDEALTPSMVPNEWFESFSPWGDSKPITSKTPLLKGADHCRRSLTPSLLEIRRINESLANKRIELFETAKVYLTDDQGSIAEKWTIGIATGGDYFQMKGVVEHLLARLNPVTRLQVKAVEMSLLKTNEAAELSIDGRRLGFVGTINEATQEQFRLRGPATVAELDFEVLAETTKLVPLHQVQSQFPVISRDMNVIVDEEVPWLAMEEIVRDVAGDLFETVAYQETYRDTQRDGENKKRILFSIDLRSQERTLTNEEADQVRQSIVAALGDRLGGVLLF